MGNKKHIITAAVLAILSLGFNPANADGSNSLVQMDVKKSSAIDTVDVTFYTTGQSSNSVVTRKANNRYVVLLPNISSSSSVAPGLGAVKDLITDVEVKHVNDGIGGYTKITFGTTKPINIKTYTKRANPVSAAQKDYKSIIAQNNATQSAHSAPKTETKPKTSTPQAQSQSKPAAEKPVSNVVKTAEKQPAKPASAIQKTTAKSEQNSPKQKLTVVEVPKIAKIASAVKPAAVKKVESKPAEAKDTAYSPKMKFDENGKRVIDLEPRVSHASNEAQDKVSDNTDKKVPVVNADINNNAADNNSVVQDNAGENKNNFPHIPLWMLIAGGSVLSLGVMFSIINAVSKAASRQKNSLNSVFAVDSNERFIKPKSKYYDIVNDSDLNWQEKYKRYSEKELDEAIKEPTLTEISYVTNLGGTKQSIITESKTPAEENNTSEKPISGILAKKSPSRRLESKTPVQSAIKSVGIKKISKDENEEFKKQMRAKISQLEHSLSQTPVKTEPEEISNEVKSEDNTIISTISDVKLKSFSRPVSLKQTNRNFVSNKKDITSYSESKYVNLKDSPLSVNRRNSASSRINHSDIMNRGGRFIENNGEMKMARENEKYLLSSLNEYLSILDSEDEKISKGVISAADSLSQIRPSEAMSRSGVSNPISRNSFVSNVNGLIVKSGYNIDSERGFYLVNMDGVSALVGRIKDSTFILKKFDRVIDSRIQVRQDDANVYIVKAGRYKCLVDVSKDKMGTLIEI